MDITYTSSGQRNANAIAQLLQRVLRPADKVFEVGSGTLQHAAVTLQFLPDVSWQPSEQSTQLDEALACWSRLNSTRILPPIEFTVGSCDGGVLADHDVILTINTLHIMPMSTVRRLFDQLAASMTRGSRFLAYGPMRVNDQHISEANRRFDRELQAGGLGQAIPDTSELVAMAQAGGLIATRQFMMPANNTALLWTKAKS